MYLNKAFIIGNLTRDPELKALPSGSKVCTFSVATNRAYKDKEGVRKEVVEYHNVAVFGRVGELSAQYLKKGSQAFVEGRLQTRSWEADGQKKYRTEIIADNVQFGGRPTSSSSSGAASSVPNSSSGEEKGADLGKGSAPSDTIEYPNEDIKPEDIPF